MTKTKKTTSLLRKARIEAGLKRADLARLTGCHRNTIYLLEISRTDPSLDTARKLATALGREISDIFP